LVTTSPCLPWSPWSLRNPPTPTCRS